MDSFVRPEPLALGQLELDAPVAAQGLLAQARIQWLVLAEAGRGQMVGVLVVVLKMAYFLVAYYAFGVPL